MLNKMIALYHILGISISYGETTGFGFPIVMIDFERKGDRFNAECI